MSITEERPTASAMMTAAEYLRELSLAEWKGIIPSQRWFFEATVPYLRGHKPLPLIITVKKNIPHQRR